MNNTFLQDKDLSIAARGLLALIMTNKEEWRVYPGEIAERAGISKRAVTNYFKELEDRGYLYTVKKGSGRGKGVEVHRFFSDYPMDDNYKEYVQSWF